MRLLHYIEIENFKRFGNSQRIELDHPAVLIGPNNCGKTSAIQAIALWSQAVKTWYELRKTSKTRTRGGTSINRLNIVAVPVQRTRFFWHNTNVRKANETIYLTLTVGVEFKGKIQPLPMRFTNDGDELVYCSPGVEIDDNILELIKYAATVNVDLLYPMSGLETQEPILQPNKINSLLGQGQTAQVLRNLCLIVARDYRADWEAMVKLMNRLFNIVLQDPTETANGNIELLYKQPDVKAALEISSSGRGFQQMLLIFAYLYSHKGSVLMVDEPDAHLEILRQKQIYVLLRDIATENKSQVIIVTHSEIILDEALDRNLTLLLDGKAENLAKKTQIRENLKNFGTENYIKARERGYVLYIEGNTDIDMLRTFAKKLNHPVSSIWDERINTFNIQNNYPIQNIDTELERVEGGYGSNYKNHFNSLKKLIPNLKGLAIQDSDGNSRSDLFQGDLTISYWKRYESENYFVNPEILMKYAENHYKQMTLFDGYRENISTVMDSLVLKNIFDNNQTDFSAWKNAPIELNKIVWESKTNNTKLSTFAESYFRDLADNLGHQMLLRKGELHLLIDLCSIDQINPEVNIKLNLLNSLFKPSVQTL